MMLDLPQAILTVGECLEKIKIENDDLKTTIEKVISGGYQDKLNGFENLQYLLETERDVVVSDIIEFNVLPKFVKFLEDDNEKILQFKCMLFLSFLTSGNEKEARSVIQSGALPYLILLVTSPEECIAEQALICVGNLACDNPYHRFMLYENGALQAVINYIKRKQDMSLCLKTGAWALANICRCKTIIELSSLTACTEAISILLNSLDEEVLREGCITAAYLTDGPDDRIQAFIDSRLYIIISNLIVHPSKFVVHAALRTMCNLLSGSSDQMAQVLECGAAEKLVHVVRYNREHCIVREACKALSNVMAGTPEDIRAVIDRGAVPILIKIARCSEEDIKLEAMWAIGNAIVACGHDLITEFLHKDIMKVLCNAMKSNNPTLVKLALQSVRNILWCGDFGEDMGFDIIQWEPENDQDFWEHADWLLEAKGFKILGKLRWHPDAEIAEEALELLDILTENPYAEQSESSDSETDDDESTDDQQFEDNLSVLKHI